MGAQATNAIKSDLRSKLVDPSKDLTRGLANRGAIK